MSYTELKWYRVTCDYDCGQCQASINVMAENHFGHLAEVLETNKWQRINSFRCHCLCPKHREDT